jgi:hypothetical protein
MIEHEKVGMIDSGRATPKPAWRGCRAGRSAPRRSPAARLRPASSWRFVVADGVVDRVVDALDGDAGISAFSSAMAALDTRRDIDIAFALAAIDAEARRPFAVHAGKGARIGPAVGDGGNVGEITRRPPASGIIRASSGLKARARRPACGSTARARRFPSVRRSRSTLVARSARLTAPAVTPSASMRAGSSSDLDFAVHAAEAVHLRHALQALQLAHGGVVDEPGQFLQRHGRRAHRIGEDRLAFHVDAVDQRIIRSCAVDRNGCARRHPSHRSRRWTFQSQGGTRQSWSSGLR